jgi:hypothetical protein
VDNIFYRKRETNLFDNLVVDIKQLYEEHPIDKKMDAKPKKVPFAQSLFHRLIYRNPLIPLRYRNILWHGARQVNIDQTWFYEFRTYWSKILHGRPLYSTYDLFFLKNVYRMKFQENQVPDTEDSGLHLNAWQKPEVLYQLLHLVVKETVFPATKSLNLLYKFTPPPNT